MSPSKDDVAAVHAVFDKQPRSRQIVANLKSIDVLMQLTPSSSGAGPNWYYLASGGLTSAVKEAARRCGDIASSQRAIAAEIKQLSIPANDRGNLVAAVTAQAASWDARGAAWMAKNKPNVSDLLDEISGHERDALDAAKMVRAYLKNGD